jgi:hypothetical protein
MKIRFDNRPPCVACTPQSSPITEGASTCCLNALDMPEHPRLKVLISAYACSPSRGSEHGVGWGWVEAISKYHDLWVLTESGSQVEIESELEKRPYLKDRIRFHFIPKSTFIFADVHGSPTHLYDLAPEKRPP